MPRANGRRDRAIKTNPYSRTPPLETVFKSEPSSMSSSPIEKDFDMKIMKHEELLSNNGMLKLTNSQRGKWDLASKIQSQVVERDLELRCSDGTIIADQVVLAAVSNFLKEIFNSESVVLSGSANWPENATGPAKIGMIGNRRKADLVTLLVPDIDCETMYNVLACFYWGFIPLSSISSERITERVQQIKVAWNVLKIDVVISKLEPVDEQLELPGRHESRLVKKRGGKRENDANFKREDLVQKFNTNHAEMLDDPDDPSPVTSTNQVHHNPKPKPVNNNTYSIKKIHECLICKGRTREGKPDKEAMNLSFKDKTTSRKVREHYVKCFYLKGKVFPYVDPEEENSDANGKVIDEFGRRYKYQCKERGCWKQQKDCGYKEIAMHNAVEHGILEKILEKETEPQYVNLLEQIRAAEDRELAKVKPLKCKIKGCPDSEISFVNDQHYLKLQTHYASKHFRGWFNKDDGGIVRSQKALEPARGTVCNTCKVRVYGHEENMMGHYASKHMRLVDAIMEGQSGVSDHDARNILVDLYPERIAHFDRSRK